MASQGRQWAFGLAIAALLVLSPAGMDAAADEVAPEAVDMTEQSAAEAGDGGVAYPNVRIEVNIPAMEMVVFEDEVPVRVHAVAIGSGLHPTPVQESAIYRIEWNPWWYPPDAEWARGENPTPPGPGNPLGRVKMPLDREVLLHGTNSESSVGRPVSHGCMRMYNADAVDLGWYIQSKFSAKGDPALLEMYMKNRRTTYVVFLSQPVPVRLVYRPVVVKDGELVIYPDPYRRIANRRSAAVMEELSASGVEIGAIDGEKVEALTKRWPTKAVTVPIEQLLRNAAEAESGA